MFEHPLVGHLRSKTIYEIVMKNKLGCEYNNFIIN